ncbi:hypothetical protein Plo01_28640 [Planobispora longispora]|uniref:Uncharacterized protein n=1 Tax=Planobispora longispora TaxID=28887 RepID=A0A8J3RKP6_9ACTN|nr:hypothetical protein Plo01_28640 [Planobispora longispora]
MVVKERSGRSIGAPGLLLIGSQVVIGLLLLYAASFPGLSPLWILPVLLVLASSGVVKQARFALSEESFEKVARSAMEGGPDWKTGPATLGSFDISWATRHGDTVRFALAGGGNGIHDHGFIWSPKGEPPLPEETDYAPDVEHFHGSWYVWRENF